MAEPSRVLMIAYNLPKGEHYWLETMLNEHAAAGERWIRAQRSVVLLHTAASPAELLDWVKRGMRGDMFIVDVTSTDWVNDGDDGVQQWLRDVRARCAAVAAEQAAAAHAARGADLLAEHGSDSKVYLEWQSQRGAAVDTSYV
ncbi:hypothetical protein [Curtobacterium sp. MCBD17_040]|uniref:hypothetical protein n=1 Tax=Curtobacterium sp. MCBD17_040 TaxID=2175674 RepID=UPI0011B70576|nr:hypothetical protein [Curtobacterium sp. MCBD17_040]WIB65876.1 hypothetical protein DEI94_17325 [Curtobacterium sp. MCBD17_040]